MRGLYIHIPFCKQKCNYCDFASFAGQEKNLDAYLNALEQEANLSKGDSCKTLYVGGGTPSLLGEEQLRRLAKIIQTNFDSVSSFQESTFEANPESLTAAKIAVLRGMGFNRLSIGLQSFNEDELKTMGRVHTAREFQTAYRAARNGGFTNINVDLIAGVPGQTLESFISSLQQLCELEPEHLSVYGLQIEEGTPFFAQGIVCDQDLMRTMLEKTHAILTEAGYHHYEISNFAKPGRESVHNTNYWQNGEYTGLGCAAASYRGGRRWQNTSRLQDYIDCMEKGESPVVFSESLCGKAKEGETLLLGLRQLDGIELTDGQWQLFGREIEKHIQNGLLTQAHKKLKLTIEGLYLANEVFRSFVSPFEEV